MRQVGDSERCVMPVYYVYILQSVKDGKFYTGYTADLEKRLHDHNRGNTRSLRNRRPLKLVYIEAFNSKTEALKKERLLKSIDGRKIRKSLIENFPKESLKQFNVGL